ncbi:hypothetical protein Acsp03_48640 [Actinomadura sp. NBRC 104412]|uniref:hypothetical protein n=1 Tax=Actinomadura sp. NBRC 104412 TaxID=3032203 RepID=UPI0024A1DE4F|nr:hypothetical protein [Actinomadura sp. NBRC 104412]GLZ07398.1 hypothetical protein Acsp03_48640 [Actinomadura sp. NBRC 104412]
MGNPLDITSGLAQAAWFESLYAAMIIPAAIPIVPIVMQAQGDAGKLWSGADGWKATIDQLEQAQRKIEELTRRVDPSHWKGDDRTAFEGTMDDYSDQLDFAIVMAWSVTVALYILAVIIGVFIYLMFVITTLLAIFATGIAIAAATVVGTPVAAQLMAQANQFASVCYRVLSTGSSIITQISRGTTYVWGAFLGTNVLGQRFNGNAQVWATFGQATMNGADDMLKGAVNYLLVKRTSEVFGANPTTRLGTPLTSRIAPLTFGEKLAATLGTADALNGSPVLGSFFSDWGNSYGTDEDGNPAPGHKYVDDTQPKST